MLDPWNSHIFAVALDQNDYWKLLVLGIGYTMQILSRKRGQLWRPEADKKIYMNNFCQVPVTVN